MSKSDTRVKLRHVTRNQFKCHALHYVNRRVKSRNHGVSPGVAACTYCACELGITGKISGDPHCSANGCSVRGDTITDSIS